MTHTILLVDDDELLRLSLAFSLEHAGYSVQTAASTEEGLKVTHEAVPDLVLHDVRLPKVDGLTALRAFQESFNVPFIFLTAQRSALDEALGLEMGADDYIVKPFDLVVLLARIKSVLRRAYRTATFPNGRATLTVGDLRVDPVAHTIRVGERLVDLPVRAFDLLHTLAAAAGQVLTMEALLRQVWGPEFVGEPQAVYVYIRMLREHLEANPAHPCRIVTVRGVGYKLVPVEGET